MSEAGPAFEVLAGRGGVPRGAEVPYGGPLRFPDSPRPYVIANFVGTIDGVVSVGKTDGTDSSTISGHSIEDRYLMALLRAASRAVVIGAGNLRATRGHHWIPGAVAGERAPEVNAYRAELYGDPAPVPLVVVTASGDLPRHVALDEPVTRVVVVTTTERAGAVRRAHPLVEVIEAGTGGAVSASAILDAVTGAVGAGVLLCEGGPALLGQLMAARAVHELFLTISPRIAGRDRDHARPGLVEGWAADNDALRSASLDSVRRAGDYLFLRYRLEA